MIKMVGPAALGAFVLFRKKGQNTKKKTKQKKVLSLSEIPCTYNSLYFERCFYSTHNVALRYLLVSCSRWRYSICNIN